MDLSFTRFDKEVELTTLPADLAVLMVGVVARQAASPTAFRHGRIASNPATAMLFAPVHGAFNGPVATALMRWKDE